MDRGIEAGSQLWERDRAIDAVTSTVAVARSGEGNGLFLIGEAGLGKTTLLESARAEGRGGVIGFGRGEEMERVVPFGLFVQVLDSLGVDASEVLDGTVEPSGPYLRALRLMRTAITRPTLILLDDLHWADRDSLGLLAFLLRRIGDLPLAVIGTLRPWPAEAAELARTLEADGLARVETIAPLGPDAARAMLARHSGTGQFDGAILEACAGNPLLIEQSAGIALHPEEGPAAEALRDRILLHRFAGLDPASLHCARCAALAGIGFRVDVAIELAGIDPAEVGATLDALTLSGLTTEAGEGKMRFTHSLFAQALYEELTPARRRRLHGRAFRILAARGLDDEATEHAIRAELAGDQEAAAVAARAGAAAVSRGAAETAVRHYRAAVRFSGNAPDPGLVLILAGALIAVARLDEAGEACAGLLSREDLSYSDRVEVLSLLAKVRYLSGAPDHGEPQAKAAVELASAHSPDRAVTALLDQSVSTWFHSGPGPTLPLAEQARDLARGLPQIRQDQAAALWGQLALECGRPEGYEAAAAIGRRLERGERAGLMRAADLSWPGAAVYWYAHCAHYTERFDESLATLTAAREVLEEAGSANGIAIVTGFISSHLVRRGQLQRALDEVTSVEEFAELTPLPMPFLRMVRAEALLWAGKVDESERECRAVETAGPANWLGAAWIGFLRGTALLWRGDVGASDRFLEVERILGEVGLIEPRFMPWAGHAIEAHLAAGRRAEAERVLAGLEEAANPESAWPRSAAALGRARLAELDGDGRRAEQWYAASVELVASVDLPLRRAESLFAQGAFLRRSRRAVEARKPLAEAVRLAEFSGADRLARIARDELHLAGGRRRHRPEERDQLTPAELRVAGLAADGLTNPEIARQLQISPHTVQSHLKRVYAKLEIDSRRKLVEVDLSGP